MIADRSFWVGKTSAPTPTVQTPSPTLTPASAPKQKEVVRLHLSLVKGLLANLEPEDKFAILFELGISEAKYRQQRLEHFNAIQGRK